MIGIVRPEKANEVLEALYRAEVRGVSMSRIQGHGGELERVETYRGTTVQVGLEDKVRFEIAVSDDFVDTTIEALAAGARTGEVGADRGQRDVHDRRVEDDHQNARAEDVKGGPAGVGRVRGHFFGAPWVVSNLDRCAHGNSSPLGSQPLGPPTRE